MDGEQIKYDAEIACLRGKAGLRLLIRLSGIVILLVGAANFFAPYIGLGTTAVPIYGYLPPIIQQQTAWDITMMAGGAILANFV